MYQQAKSKREYVEKCKRKSSKFKRIQGENRIPQREITLTKNNAQHLGKIKWLKRENVHEE